MDGPREKRKENSFVTELWTRHVPVVDFHLIVVASRVTSFDSAAFIGALSVEKSKIWYAISKFQKVFYVGNIVWAF
jgi:hypothetical protein